MIAGLDLGTNRTGFTVGDGASLPYCDAWRFSGLSDDLAAVGVPFWKSLATLCREHQVKFLVYEAPLLARYRDKVLMLRHAFGMGFAVETFCGLHGIVCAEEPFGPIKRELTGKSNAEKSDMVAVAQRLGIHLPSTKAAGMEDAADSVGAWLIGVRHFARSHTAAWDQAIFSRRPFRPK